MCSAWTSWAEEGPALSTGTAGTLEGEDQAQEGTAGQGPWVQGPFPGMQEATLQWAWLPIWGPDSLPASLTKKGSKNSVLGWSLALFGQISSCLGLGAWEARLLTHCEREMCQESLPSHPSSWPTIPPAYFLLLSRLCEAELSSETFWTAGPQGIAVMGPLTLKTPSPPWVSPSWEQSSVSVFRPGRARGQPWRSLSHSILAIAS